MSNKLSDLDRLITEVLSEKIGPLKVKDVGDIVQFGDDEIKKYHDKRYAKDFAAMEPPKGEFSLKDIKKLLTALRLKTATNISKNAAIWQLQKAKDIITKSGSEEEKINWHIALYLLQKNFDLSRKLKMPNPLRTFTTIRGPLSRDDFAKYAQKGTWIGVNFDPDPAAFGDTIDQKELAPQEVHSLFKSDLRNAGGETGNFPADVTNAINVAFDNTNNLYQRIQAITDFSTSMAQALENPDQIAPNLGGPELQQLLARSVLLDYFTSMVSDMDDGAGAYLFETFLAALAGGKVEGKLKTAGGQMAATDFSFAGGAAGSAKYYSKVSGIHQAIGGFEPNKPMHYVVGIKNKDNSLGDGIIKSVDIYYYKIYMTQRGKQPGGKFTHANVYAFDPEGAPLNPDETWQATADLNLGKSFLYTDSTKIGTINILGAGGASGKMFKDKILQAANNVNKDFGEILSGLGDVATSATAVKEDTNKYAMEGSRESGNKAVGSMNNLNKFFGSLYDKLTEMGYQSSSEKVQYQKISEKKNSKI